MVSGLVTSSCDQLRIFSGEARLMRMASKSAMGLAISKGLERNKVILHSCGCIVSALRLLNQVVGHWPWSLAFYQRNLFLRPGGQEPTAGLCFQKSSQS